MTPEEIATFIEERAALEDQIEHEADYTGQRGKGRYLRALATELRDKFNAHSQTSTLSDIPTRSDELAALEIIAAFVSAPLEDVLGGVQRMEAREFAAQSRIRELEAALRSIADPIPCRGDKGGDCAYCGGVSAIDDLDKHEDDCPWRIARVALARPKTP